MPSVGQKDSYKERIPKNTLTRTPIRKRLLNQGNRCQPFTTIKAPIPSLTKVCIIHPSSGTLELWEVLTWSSEGIWPTPHRCSLWGLLSLCCAGVVSSTWEPCGLLLIFRHHHHLYHAICYKHYLPSCLILYLNLDNHYFREEKVDVEKFEINYQKTWPIRYFI